MSPKINNLSQTKLTIIFFLTLLSETVNIIMSPQKIKLLCMAGTGGALQKGEEEETCVARKSGEILHKVKVNTFLLNESLKSQFNVP